MSRASSFGRVSRIGGSCLVGTSCPSSVGRDRSCILYTVYTHARDRVHACRNECTHGMNDGRRGDGDGRESAEARERREDADEAGAMEANDGRGTTRTRERLTVETINEADRRYNPTTEYELDLRGLRIAAIENLGAARDQYDCYDLTDNDIVKVENFPKMSRARTLLLANNRVARVNGEELAERLPALRTLVLTNNSLRNLADVDGLGACPRLTMLSLVGNPVALKENYRLYVVYKCKHLKTLDFQRVKPAERELAEKTFGADDGAAARAKTFTPGDGLEDKTEKEEEKAAPSGPTPEQLMALKVAIANAETLDEVARLENALKTGVVPKDLEI